VYFQDSDITYLVDGQQRVTMPHLLLILIHNPLVDQDALSEAGQLETLIRNVMYGERRYTIDIEERTPLLDALMSGKPYEIKPDDRPSVRNLWDRYRDLEEQFPSNLSGEALSYFHDWLLHRVWSTPMNKFRHGTGFHRTSAGEERRSDAGADLPSATSSASRVSCEVSMVAWPAEDGTTTVLASDYLIELSRLCR
jgi:hypothetical protein